MVDIYAFVFIFIYEGFTLEIDNLVLPIFGVYLFYLF